MTKEEAIHLAEHYASAAHQTSGANRVEAKLAYAQTSIAFSMLAPLLDPGPKKYDPNF